MAFLPVYVLILFVTIVVDYFAGLWIERAEGKKRKWYLIISLVANIGFLCFFKYFDFIAENINAAFSLAVPMMKDLWLSSQIIEANNLVNEAVNHSLGTDLGVLENIVLPIGLSFHTFQAMSYTIEVYRGNQKAERHFGIYALYVMFYPQLVAGPIERPQNVLHQYHERKYFSYENLITGLRLMAWGLFKKVVIADRLAVYVNLVYDNPQDYHWLNVVVATLFFAIQIYCDFSGYSDMAIGAAKTMGYDLMINFRRPYFATNIKEFWDKWHISLSTWFRDYLYIPLGGNRVPFGRLLLNVSIVFIVSGLWHGANWTFIVWGALHAFYIIIYTVFSRLASQQQIKRQGWLWNSFGWGLTFFAVCFAWIFFRAENLAQAGNIIRHLFTFQAPQPFTWIVLSDDMKTGFGLVSMLLIVLCGWYMLLIERKYGSTLVEFNHRPGRDVVFMSATVFAIIAFGVFVKESFIYFQF